MFVEKNRLAVVAMRLGKSVSDTRRARPTPSNVRTATWPDGFRPKSTLPTPREDLPKIVTNPAQPVTHVMSAWEPAHRHQPSPQVVEAAKPLVNPPIVKHGAQPAPTPRAPRAPAQEIATRAFADPFAHDDDGANCIRCGLLVEAARESRGMLTCAKCG